jgi:hypothetical protein
MKKIITALCMLLFSCAVQAGGSSPGLYYGQVPTAAQWNSYFASKLDYTPGSINTVPYWDGSGNLRSAPISGDCTSVANVFTCTMTGSLSSPPAIGNVAPNTGSFTSLAASSTVSGTGFSTYLASPPAIGGTVRAAGAFTTLGASSTLTASSAVTVAGTLSANGIINAASVINAASDVNVTGTLAASAVTATASMTAPQFNGNATTATTIAGTANQSLPTFDCTQASGALTFSSTSSYLAFRNASLTNGTPSVVNAAPANLVLPSGGTLGVPTTLSGRIYIAEINNVGTREIAITNSAGGLQVNEENLISTTAISSGSTANNVWYSTSARTSLPYKIIGACDAVNTAGAWSSPTVKINAGGNALTAMSSFGYGQTVQDLTGSRAFGTTYYNNTGRPIKIRVYGFATSSASGSSLILTVAGVAYPAQTISESNGVSYVSMSIPVEEIIGVGESYVITQTNTTLSKWFERR